MKSSSDMGFLDHLEELRWRIVKGLAAVLVGAIVVFLFMDDIFAILLRPLRQAGNPATLQNLRPYGLFMLQWGVAIVGGFVVALPVVTYQIWKFVAPGLLTSERKYAFPLIIFTFVAFGLGVVFAYYVIIPFSLEFFASISHESIQDNFSINYYFSYVLWILVAAGLLFELPVLVTILSSIGLVTPAFMRHYRRHAIVVILILSAFITPPDPVSLLMMSLPMVLLYELSIGLSNIFSKKF